MGNTHVLGLSCGAAAPKARFPLLCSAKVPDKTRVEKSQGDSYRMDNKRFLVVTTLDAFWTKMSPSYP